MDGHLHVKDKLERENNGYLLMAWDSSSDFNTNNALSCGSDIVSVSVNSTVLSLGQSINPDNSLFISNYHISI